MFPPLFSIVKSEEAGVPVKASSNVKTISFPVEFASMLVTTGGAIAEASGIDNPVTSTKVKTLPISREI